MSRTSTSNLAPHVDGDALRGGPGLLDPAAVAADVVVHENVAVAVERLLASGL